MVLKQKEVLFMNNKGQSLIMFVLILPLISMFIAFFIDSTLSILEKNKIDGIIVSNMENALKNDIRDAEKIRSAIKDNEDMNVSVIIEEDNMHVLVNSNKKSIFGKLLKFEYYQLNYNYCGDYITLEINKKCG